MKAQVVSTKQLKIETCSQPEAACSSLADLSQQGSSAGFGFAKCHIRVGKLIGFCFNRTRFYREALKYRISGEVSPRWRLLSLCLPGTSKVVQFRPSRQHPHFQILGNSTQFLSQGSSGTGENNRIMQYFCTNCQAKPYNTGVLQMPFFTWHGGPGWPVGQR